jgi:hypothetical protein
LIKRLFNNPEQPFLLVQNGAEATAKIIAVAFCFSFQAFQHSNNQIKGSFAKKILKFQRYTPFTL